MDTLQPARGRSHVRHETRSHSSASTGTTTTRAVDRALAVLCAFTRETPWLGVSEINQRLGLHKSTVHRLLQVLLSRGMVAQDATHRRYALGYRVLALAQAVPGEATLRQVSRPHMQWLRTTTQETVGLYVATGDVRMCLEELESPQMLRMAAGAGRCFPLHRGAASKALLVDGPASGEPWQRATAALDAPTRAELARAVREVRHLGYAQSAGETVPGACSIAAPIRDPRGGVVAALMVGGPASRFQPETVPDFVAPLLEAVDRIQRDLRTAPATLLEGMPNMEAPATS